MLEGTDPGSWFGVGQRRATAHCQREQQQAGATTQATHSGRAGPFDRAGMKQNSTHVDLQNFTPNERFRRKSSFLGATPLESACG